MCHLLQGVLGNWGSECAKWAPGMKTYVYDGSPEERRAMAKDVIEKGNFHILITHYDLAMREKGVLRKVNSMN